jgi:hypothetical protein
VACKKGETYLPTYIHIHVHTHIYYIYINAIPIGQIFVKFDSGDIYGNLSRKLKFVSLTKTSGHFKRIRIVAAGDVKSPRHTSALDSTVWLSNARRMHGCVPTATVIARTRHGYVMVTLLWLVMISA